MIFCKYFFPAADTIVVVIFRRRSYNLYGIRDFGVINKMKTSHIGLDGIVGSLVVLEGAKDAFFDEMAVISLPDGSKRNARVVEIQGDKAVLQVFEGAAGLSRANTVTGFTGRPMELALSPGIIGRTFDGMGRPIDGLGEVYPKVRRNINGSAINPVERIYPEKYIHTGFSAIDALSTLIRGQKLPIFSGSGMKHNELASGIVRQASAGGEAFTVVFAAMGVKNDVADYFRRSFEQGSVASGVTMFLNLSSDPIIERIITPRCALTAAEYLAFDLGLNVLVVMTDMTAYCEALREFSSSKGEIPGRKGFPGYLYSDLASLYERAGLIRGCPGSVTQIPILTMPNDDITNPVPDLTGFITEGQIVLDRELDASGIFPPVDPLRSLSRLMKDGIGEGCTRADHKQLADQLFASYSQVQEVRSLASVIGEDELSANDKTLLAFGRAFESEFIDQSNAGARTMAQTLDLGWKLLSMLPRASLDRVKDDMLDAHYIGNS